VVDIEALEGVVNELKTKLNTLINDVLVEHSIDNIHNYDDTNIKDLKEISDQIGDFHTDINNITTKLANITSTTTKLALNKPTQLEIISVVNENDRSHGIFAPQYILLVNKDAANTFYEGLHLGGASTESGSELASSTKASISHTNLLHKVEVTANQTNKSDINRLVFSYTADGVKINDFSNTNHVIIP
jgi:hypothetical protein